MFCHGKPQTCSSNKKEKTNGAQLQCRMRSVDSALTDRQEKSMRLHTHICREDIKIEM